MPTGVLHYTHKMQFFTHKKPNLAPITSRPDTSITAMYCISSYKLIIILIWSFALANKTQECHLPALDNNNNNDNKKIIIIIIKRRLISRHNMPGDITKARYTN